MEDVVPIAPFLFGKKPAASVSVHSMVDVQQLVFSIYRTTDSSHQQLSAASSTISSQQPAANVLASRATIQQADRSPQ
jgi:hypothetical protein